MKRIILMMVAVAATFITYDSFAIFGIKIKIAISSRAYWDGTGCQPRDKGGCVHIGGEAMPAQPVLNNDKGKLSLVFPESALNSQEYGEMFNNGGFYSGEISIDRMLLEKVGYNEGNIFVDKRYKYSISKGEVIVPLN